MTQQIPQRVGNLTELVFCREDVDPDLVTAALGLSPSYSIKVGQPEQYESGFRHSSHLGIWRLRLPNCDPFQTVEGQIASWVDLLGSRAAAFAELKALGYCPYLDCQSERGSLSLCVDPELLMQLGSLNISLSVWLYESESGHNAA